MFTQQDLDRIIVALLMYSSANNNQGLKSIAGNTYGEQSVEVMIAFQNSMSASEMCSIIKVNS